MKMSFSVLPLIGLPDNTGGPAVPDRVQDALSSGHDKLNTTDEIKLESTRFVTTKLLLRAVTESADAFPPLKSVVGALSFILDSYEV